MEGVGRVGGGVGTGRGTGKPMHTRLSKLPVWRTPQKFFRKNPRAHKNIL